MHCRSIGSIAVLLSLFTQCLATGQDLWVQPSPHSESSFLVNTSYMFSWSSSLSSTFQALQMTADITDVDLWLVSKDEAKVYLWDGTSFHYVDVSASRSALLTWGSPEHIDIVSHLNVSGALGLSVDELKYTDTWMFMFSPHDEGPGDIANLSSGTVSSPLFNIISASATSSSTPTISVSTSLHKSSQAISSSAKAGIVIIAVVVFATLVLAIVWLVFRQKRVRRTLSRVNSDSSETPLHVDMESVIAKAELEQFPVALKYQGPGLRFYSELGQSDRGVI